MQTICREYGIKGEEFSCYFSYKYFGYIRITNMKNIDVITRDNSLSFWRKDLERSLRRGIAVSPLFNFNSTSLPPWLLKKNLQKSPQEDRQSHQEYVTIDNDRFLEALYIELVTNGFWVKLFFIELGGETTDLNPVIKKELFHKKKEPVTPPKVYLDEHGTEMPFVVQHGVPERGFPRRK